MNIQIGTIIRAYGNFKIVVTEVNNSKKYIKGFSLYQFEKYSKREDSIYMDFDKIQSDMIIGLINIDAITKETKAPETTKTPEAPKTNEFVKSFGTPFKLPLLPSIVQLYLIEGSFNLVGLFAQDLIKEYFKIYLYYTCIYKIL